MRLTAKLSGKENIFRASVGSSVDILLHEQNRRFELDWQDHEHAFRHRGSALRSFRVSRALGTRLMLSYALVSV